MKVKVTKRATVNVQVLLQGKNRKQIGEKLIRRTAGPIRRIASAHYQAIGDFVNSQTASAGAGMSGVGGGSRSLRGYDGAGRPIKVSTGYWPGLSHDYVKRKPRSTRMWRKRGVLADAVRSDLRASAMRAKVKNTSVKPAKQKNHVRVKYDLAFTPLANNVLNQLIAAPFIFADASVGSGFSAYSILDSAPEVARTTSELMAFPELAGRKDILGRSKGFPKKVHTLGPVNRPWVAKASGEFGAKMHSALQRGFVGGARVRRL